MIRTIRWLLLAAMLAADAGLAAPNRDTYLVEFVVFERTAPDTGSELWTREYALPDVRESIDFAPLPGAPEGAAATRAAPVAAADSGPVMPSPAPPGKRLLATALQRLTTSGAYRVLYSEAWVQDITPKSTARSVRIHPRFSDTEVPRLDGLARLYRGQFLQLEMDLVYEPPESTASAVGVVPGQYRFQLAERRRVKPNEVNYFDHPRFGVLFVMSPVEKTAR